MILRLLNFVPVPRLAKSLADAGALFKFSSGNERRYLQACPLCERILYVGAIDSKNQLADLPIVVMGLIFMHLIHHRNNDSNNLSLIVYELGFLSIKFTPYYDAQSEG